MITYVIQENTTAEILAVVEIMGSGDEEKDQAFAWSEYEGGTAPCPENVSITEYVQSTIGDVSEHHICVYDCEFENSFWVDSHVDYACQTGTYDPDCPVWITREDWNQIEGT